MREFIGANWLVLVPIVVLSIAALAVIIERGAYFYRIRDRRGSSLQDALFRLGRASSTLVMDSFDDGDASPARVLLEEALQPQAVNTPGLFKQRMEALRDRHIDRMERHLPILPGIGNVATLMGLFGTVSGMITAFSRMTETGNSDPYVLAGGISRALVTTAAGLAVAIPALAAHHLFEAVIDRHCDRMDDVLTECLAKNGAAYARKREQKNTSA